jgi:hypothetical protein
MTFRILGHGRQRAGHGVRQSWARRPPPAWRSPATRPPATRSFMASFSSTRRARTWWPASARRNHHREARIEAGMDRPSLESLMPETFAELIAICDRLEKHYRDMQDLEFTIQDGKLWMLQTRSGKRTAQAGTQDCRGHGRRRADHRKLKRCHAHRPGLARPAAAPHARPACRARHHRHRPAGLARCGHRRDRVRPRGGRRGPPSARPQGHSGAA